MAVAFKPEGFQSVVPYLIVDGAVRLIDFVQQAFDADVLGRTDRPDGRVMHAAVKIGDSVVEISDSTPEWPATKAAIHLYIEDVDDAYARAVKAGATTLRPPTNQPYGDREADIVDPCGNQWFVATHKEDISADEFRKRLSQRS